MATPRKEVVAALPTPGPLDCRQASAEAIRHGYLTIVRNEGTDHMNSFDTADLDERDALLFEGCVDHVARASGVSVL